MKQGQGVTVTSMKVEPIPHTVNVGGVSELGESVYQNLDPLFDGRGFSAPRPVKKTTSNSGSQGDY